MISIRLATIDDAPEIADAHVLSWREAYSRLMPEATLTGFSVLERTASWRDDIGSGNVSVFIAKSNRTVAGLLAIARSRDEDVSPGTLEIRSLYIAPDFWRQGIGRALCLEADSFAKSCDAKMITLWVLTRNSKARHFYQSMGFSEQPGMLRSYARHDVALQQIRYGKAIC
jgi:ribosomal protein S18 acetylase RimI-like enzyme